MTDTEKQPEDAGGREEPEPSRERIDELGAHIEAVRQSVDDQVEPADQDDQSFIESGEEAPVDDTIAPPA